MKKFEIYRDIRARALIFGLPLPLFALQMLGIIASLLVIIFSFRFVLVFGALLGNGVLYALLLKLANQPQWLSLAKGGPKLISNKKTSLLRYADQS